MTPYEFWCKSEGYKKSEQKKWEHTRFISYCMAGDGKQTLSDFLPIYEHEFKGKEPLSKDDIETMMKKYQNIRK